MTTPTKGVFLPASADALARIHTAEAVGTLIQAMRGEIVGIKPGERIRAAETIIERGHGKAVQAVIQVPQRAAIAAKLAALSDDELLAIARGGSTPPKRGPMAEGEGEGPIQPGESTSPESLAYGLVPRASKFDADDVVDGEIDIGYDPLG